MSYKKKPLPKKPRTTTQRGALLHSRKNPNIICQHLVKPGERKIVSLEVARLYDFTAIDIPVEIIRGKQPGPTLFISAAIHGDEINGSEIIRQVLRKKILRQLNGTLIALPVVNVYGFNSRSRYLPDGRDLNRAFPGSKSGSLASNIAHIFMKEVVSRCTHGIDFHTAAVHRKNLPQIRACLDDPETKELAKAFGTSVILNSKVRDGSLREAARKRRIPMLLFEGGEALRFEADVIKSGVRGTLSVMRKIGMIPELETPHTKPPSFVAQDSFWVRAPNSGSLKYQKKIGQLVRKGDQLALIQDLFGKSQLPINCPEDGVIIGANQVPLLNKGDAVFHIATFKNLGRVSRHLTAMELT